MYIHIIVCVINNYTHVYTITLKPNLLVSYNIVDQMKVTALFNSSCRNEMF